MTVASSAMLRVATPVRRALRSDFMRHGALVFVASMMTNASNYAFNFVISRNIGVENYAVLSALIGLMMVLSIPATIMALVVAKYSAEFNAVDDRAHLWLLCKKVMKTSGILSAVILAVGLAARGSIASYLRIPNDGIMVLAIAVLTITFVTPSVRAILQGCQNFKRFSASVVIEAMLKTILAITLVYAGFGVLGAMLGWSAGAAIALVYTLLAVRGHRVASTGGARLTLDYRRLAQVTGGIAIATGALTLMSFMDVPLVKHYFDARQAGLYAAVNLTGKVVLFLVSFLPAIILPKAIDRARQGQSPARILKQAGLATILIAGSALSIFAVMPVLVVRVLAGHAFIAAAPYVFQYDLAMGFLAIVTLLVNYRIAVHRFEFLYALIAVLAVEISAIAIFHQTIWDVVHILLFGNLLAIAACSYGLRVSHPVAASDHYEAFQYAER